MLDQGSHASGSSTPPLVFGKNSDILVPVVLWCGAPSHWVTSILITPDKKTIISGSQSGHIIISAISLDKGKENHFLPKIFAIGHESAISCLSLGDFEGKEVVVSAATDGSMAVWNIKDGYCLMSTQPGFLSCSPSKMVSLPNMKQVAVIGKGSNSIFIIDIHTLKIVSTLAEHTNWITCLHAFSLDEDQSPMLISGALDGTIRFWSLKAGECDFPLQIICLSPQTNNNSNTSNSNVNTESNLTMDQIEQQQLQQQQQTLGMEYCSADDSPLTIEISPNGKSLLVVTKNQWSIFTTNNSHRLYSIDSCTKKGWLGGSFVNDSLLLVWSSEGSSYLYKIDQSFLKSFSLGQPIPLPGASPLITALSSSLSKSYGSLSSSSQNLENVLNTSQNLQQQMNLSYVSGDIPQPSLILSFNTTDNNSSNISNCNGNPLKHSASFSSNTSSTEPSMTNYNQHMRSVGAAQSFSNVFVIGDAFGRIKVWVIPVNAIDQGTTPLKKLLREPNLVGNIHDGWKHTEQTSKPKRVTASLVLEDLMLLIRGHEDGSISTSRLPTDLLVKVLPNSHGSKVNCLMTSQPGNVKRLLFSASNDTTIKVWELGTFKLLHTFSHHTGPVTSIFSLPHSRGRNSFISISEDKTIGMYSMEDLSCKHMFGVHSSPIHKVLWKSEQGYLIVDTIDGSVSIWEIGSGELEGVIYGQNAKDILDNAEILSNNWKQQIKLIYSHPFTTKSLVYNHKNDPPIQTLFLNIKNISDEITKFNDLNTKYQSTISHTSIINLNQQNQQPNNNNELNNQWIQGKLPELGVINQNSTTYVQKELNHLISIISYLIPWGMDKNLDLIYKKDFQLRPPQPDFSFGLLGHRGNISFLTPSASNITGKVQCSELLTAQTTLAAVSLGKSLSKVGGVENACSQLTTFYCTELPNLHGYVYPDYSYLASYYCQENSEDIMTSARSIFKTSLEMMPTPIFTSLLQSYHSLLSSDSLSLMERSKVVIVLGIITSNRPQDCIQEISTKVGQELMKLIFKGSGHLTVTAVELIGKGFNLWKDHLRDIAPLIKCLFSLTTQSEPFAGASKATLLQIGSVDPLRFIQVITEEITKESANPVQSSHAIVLVASLIKKDPSILLTFLPRIIESIIKALDPHTPHIREHCIKCITAVIHLMVNKYPMISFHSESQKIVLGTLDGHLVIYDLKTATRWHRIEAHEQCYISAVEFNENGKALASYSSKDNVVKIWQGSSSFFGLLGSQFNCIKTFTPPGFEKLKSYNSTKIENISLKWSGSSLLLVRDERSVNYNLEGILN